MHCVENMLLPIYIKMYYFYDYGTTIITLVHIQVKKNQIKNAEKVRITKTFKNSHKLYKSNIIRHRVHT